MSKNQTLDLGTPIKQNMYIDIDNLGENLSESGLNSSSELDKDDLYTILHYIRKKDYKRAFLSLDFFTIFCNGYCLFLLGRYTEAIGEFQQLTIREGDVSDESMARVIFNMALCYDKQENPEVANVYYFQAFEKNPDNRRAIIHYTKNCIILQENIKESIQLLENYLEKNPKDEDILTNLNIILGESDYKGKEKVIHSFNKVLLEKVPQPSLIYNHGCT
ncbi:hypothetical protein PPERSA_06139 [Pseudocohnilembus persalinus]|uniref:Uncharacterized protein n=1 Tax=Pseudocohnilembus persalinus TaxID=266149 RepID=A0A0V0QVP8_PSEPJ|nr:hypothetical protein PPERSA_06139 [Pseudocohnilembus persalinus]|eukprot:KRX06257.1 hypothetical protein PPERSA_06139 [Pseudocohnilembus persalinus]